MKRLIVIWLLLAAGAALAAERPADFAYGVTLEVDGKEALYEVTLPAATYRGVVRADLADVRVFNGAGEVVPHAWRPRRTAGTEAAAAVALTLFPLKAEAGASVDGISIRVRRGPGDRSSVDVTSTSAGGRKGAAKHTVGYFVDLTALDRALHAIEFEWQPVPDGFAGKLRVEASDDLGSWRTLVAAAPLVNLEVAGQRLQQKRVELPQQKVKYLRLSWVPQGAGAAPPELASARGEPVEKTVNGRNRSRQKARSPANIYSTCAAATRSIACACICPSPTPWRRSSCSRVTGATRPGAQSRAASPTVCAGTETRSRARSCLSA